MTAHTIHQIWYLGVTAEDWGSQDTHKRACEKVLQQDKADDGRCQLKHRNSRRRSYDFLLWQDFFRDPSLWWDNRKSKLGPACPDFKHKITKESLWIDGWFTPPWVLEELQRIGLAQHDAELCEHNDSNTHNKGNDEAAPFVALLRTCAKYKDLHRGIRAHDDILKRGLLKKCSDALVTMYAKCGALTKAKELLDMHTSRDVISWTTLISGYAQQGQGEDALKCFEQMQHEGLSPDAVTFSCILKACGSIGAIDKGQQIHDEIFRQGLLENDIVLGTALVDMYAKCGALAKAQRVFEKLSSRNVITWSALITGYVQQGKGEQGLKCFEQMQNEGLSPDAKTFACILKACGNIGAAEKGERIHDELSRQGLLRGNDIVLGTALVDMYAKCGALAKAAQVFETLPSRDVTSWSALIAGYAQQGEGQQALDCFERMQDEGLSPNAVTFCSILKACGNIGAVDKGKQIHDEIAVQGLLGNNYALGTALVDMYAKCGALARAQQVLQELPSRDVSTWSALIAGYAQQGQGEQLLNCFEQMQLEGLSPDSVTFSSVLSACSHLGLVDDGHMYFESMSAKYGMKPELEHYLCMVDLFGRAGHLDKAVGVIQGMPFSNYVEVWSALLGACRKWGDVNVGRWAFEHASQLDKKNPAAYVLMADIYAAAGMQEDAENIEAMRVANNAWKRPGSS